MYEPFVMVKVEGNYVEEEEEATVFVKILLDTTLLMLNISMFTSYFLFVFSLHICFRV